MKLLFFGTPAEAVPFLAACGRNEVVGVVTRPDRPAGRGLEVRPPPVKRLAEELGAKIYQPESPSAIAGELKALGADVAVVVAYGKILKADVLASTRLGFLNVHFSLLPKFRGAAPVAWALIRGESRTGVTLFWLDEGMDTGPVQSCRRTVIGPDEDAPALMARLIDLGMEALEKGLLDIGRGLVRREPQAGRPSLAPKLRREDGRLRLDRPARELHDLARGLRGGPGAFLALEDGRELGILRTAVDIGDSAGAPTPAFGPAVLGAVSEGALGTVVRVEKERGFLIQCSSGRLWILEVQPQGKKQIPAADFLNGLRLKAGDRLPVRAP